MRTNVVIDDRLLAEAMRLSSLKTKRGLIEKAIHEFVENRKRLDLRKLKGKIAFRDGQTRIFDNNFKNATCCYHAGLRRY